MTDYVEFCVTCTDVLTPDGHLDTDGDGLTNAEEGIYGSNPDDLDSDNDNLRDYEEIKVLGTNPAAKDTDGDGVYDDAELELGLDPLLSKTDGVTPDAEIQAAENRQAALQSNVIDPDSLVHPNEATVNSVIQPPTMEELDPGGSWETTFSGKLYTKYDGTVYSSNVSYQLNYALFFGSSATYHPSLAVTSSLLSAIAYDDNYMNITSGGTLTTSAAKAVEDWMTFHGFDYHGSSYDLDYHKDKNSTGFQDQHVSEMFVGHKEVLYNNVTKNIVCVIIRGTNETLDEWQSNFDVGSTAVHGDTAGWEYTSNHMGFDITTTRLNDKLDDYMDENNLTKNNSILWIMGHSRGGALANLLAARRIITGHTVFGYTFAAPATTTTNERSAWQNYPSIFNIINEDDFVPQLPLSDWGFRRYGYDKPGSIEDDGYADDWDALISGNLLYTSNQTGMENAIGEFESIASNRSECYLYRDDDDAYYTYMSSSFDDVMNSYNAQIASYPSNTTPYYEPSYPIINGGLYSYKIYHQPAFLMQLLAAVMSEGISGEIAFVVIKPSKYLAGSHSAIYAISKYIKHPHYPESYYLLAKNIT